MWGGSFLCNINKNIKFLVGYFRFFCHVTFELDPLRKRKSHPMIKDIKIFGL